MKNNTQFTLLPLFQALSDSHRLKIIETLRHQELCACDLATALSITPSKLSFHLKTLKAAHLIQGRQEGRWIYYRLNLQQFIALEEYIAEFRRLSAILPAQPCLD